jgi:hypothetical protein
MKYPSNEHPIFFASTFYFILLYVVVLLRVCSAESGLKPVHPKRTSDGPKVAIGFKPDPAEQAVKSNVDGMDVITTGFSPTIFISHGRWNHSPVAVQV